MRILADRIIAEAEQAFAAYGEVTLFDGRELTNSQLLNTDVLLVRSVTKVNEPLLAGTPIKFVGTATAGVDHVDQKALASLDIPFTSAAGCNANAVAEFIATSVLKFCVDEDLVAANLSVGVIGHGEVGRRVAAKLNALGLRCLINDPPKAIADPQPYYCDLATTLGADIVTLHAPLTMSGEFATANLIGAGELEAMENCRLFINAARGGIVDEEALITKKTLDENFSFQLDCWIDEPQISTESMTSARLASPHVAGHTIEARVNATRILATSLSHWSGIDNDWISHSAQRERPGGEQIPTEIFGQLEVSGDFDWQAYLAKMMEYCCPVVDIDRAARDLAGQPLAQRGVLFDKLRRDFASRREFSFYRRPDGFGEWVRNQSGNDLSQNMLDTLGFQL